MLLHNYFDRQQLRFTNENLGLSQAAQCNLYFVNLFSTAMIKWISR